MSVSLVEQYEEFSKRAEIILESYEDHYTHVMSGININEKFALNRIDSDLDELDTMFKAARRGLGLVNQLSPGESKQRNAKRVMTNLNKIRAALRNLERKIADMLKS